MSTKVIITIRSGKEEPWKETYDADNLIDPRFLGKRLAERVAVSNEAEANTWATRLISAFNHTRRPGEPERSVVEVQFEVTADELVHYEKAKPFDGPVCPRRCYLCCDHEEEYATEHHWMLEYEEENPDCTGYLQCRHCDAKRDLPIHDDEFLEAFNL